MLGDVGEGRTRPRDGYGVGVLEVAGTVVYHYSVTTRTLLRADVEQRGVRTTVTERRGSSRLFIGTLPIGLILIETKQHLFSTIMMK